jgi:hypothetical protein
MSIAILCEQCHRRLQLPEEFIEEVVRCPVCGHTQKAGETQSPSSPSPSRPASEPIDESLIPAAQVPHRSETNQPGWGGMGSTAHHPLMCPYCERSNVENASACVGCQAAIDASSLKAHLGRLQEARGQWGCVSQVLGFIGLWLGSVCFVGVRRLGDGDGECFGYPLAISLFGVGLFCCGLAAAARAKGENAKWGLLGLVALCCLIQPIWWVGCIALALPTFLVGDRNGRLIKRLEGALRIGVNHAPASGASHGPGEMP